MSADGFTVELGPYYSISEGVKGNKKPGRKDDDDDNDDNDDCIVYLLLICTAQTLTKLVTQIRFTLLLRIRLLRYSGASGLT